MPQLIPQEDGTEKEFYTKEEFESTQTKVTQLESEIRNLQVANGEMSTNFKRYRDMTDEEKSLLTESERTANIQLGILQDELQAMKQKQADDAAATANNLKELTIERYSQGNPEMREKMLKQWEIINIDVVDQRTAQERGRIAFMAAGGVLTDSNKNPLFADYSGDAPTPNQVPGAQKVDKTKAFMESERGLAAQAAMGIKSDA